MHIATIQDSILFTLGYFAGYRYPLTLQELSWWLMMMPQDEKDISDARLHTLCASLDGVVVREGHYMLAGCEEDLMLRKTRYVIAERKYARALWAVRIIAVIPYVRMVAVCNDLALSDASEESDIDLFVVTARKHIWWVRCVAAYIMKLYGRRPTAQSRRDTICLSFFAADDALDLQSLALEDTDGVGDLYLAVWCATLMPLYDVGGVMHRMEGANTWIRVIISRARPFVGHPLRTVALGWWMQMMKSCGELLLCYDGGVVERACRAVSMRFLPRDLRDMVGRDTRVVLDDRYLKFHPNDRRAYYRDEAVRRYAKIRSSVAL